MPISSGSRNGGQENALVADERWVVTETSVRGHSIRIFRNLITVL
jgi:hypothetical protein